METQVSKTRSPSIGEEITARILIYVETPHTLLPSDIDQLGSLSSFPVISRNTSFNVGSSVYTRPNGISSE